MSHTILVSFDFSDASDRALAWAAAEQRVRGGTVQVLHVINPIPLAAVTMPAVAPPPTQLEIDETRDAVRRAMQAHGLDGDPEIVLSPAPGEAIVRTAIADRCDLVVMGTHGRGGLKRAVLGSVADYVVRHAECPVLTVRAHAAAA
jgi:nucleotide-binding universal stress UspA family protein